MFKVLIVDDEKIICQLVKRLIDWSSLELEFAGEAYNYTQAVKLIQEQTPDIVITDIKMPQKDGISLIETIRSQSYDISIITISGCREFEYARNMLKYDVEDYLLKPIQKRELNATLQRIINKKKIYLENKTKEHISISKCRELFMRKLLELPASLPEKSLTEINREYHFNFTGDFFALLAVKADFKQEICTNSSLCSRILDNIRLSMLNTIHELFFESEAVIIDSRIYILISAEEPESEFIEKIKKVITPIVSMNLQKHEIINLSVVMDSFHGNLYQISQCLENANQILDHRMDFAQNEFIVRRAASFIKDFGPDKNLYKQIDGQIKLLTDTLEKNIFIAFICDLLNLPDLTNYGSLCAAYYTLNKVEELVSECSPSKQLRRETDEKLKNSIHRQVISDIMKSYLEKILENWILFKQETEKKPIRQVKTYIEENYNQDVNLDSLSRLVYLNPIYLSSMFKQETGISITDYIIEVRIKKAKELLTDTPMFIGDIAGAVGYKDTRYFSRLFLKHVGIKPTEYRKYHS